MATASRSNVPGSGTAATLDAAIGAPLAAEGSKTNVPPAPTFKLVPSGMAVDVVATSVPANTVVPPL